MAMLVYGSVEVKVIEIINTYRYIIDNLQAAALTSLVLLAMCISTIDMTKTACPNPSLQGQPTSL